MIGSFYSLIGHFTNKRKAIISICGQVFVLFKVAVSFFLYLNKK